MFSSLLHCLHMCRQVPAEWALEQVACVDECGPVVITCAYMTVGFSPLDDWPVWRMRLTTMTVLCAHSGSGKRVKQCRLLQIKGWV
jgi:hypothetical protein